MNMDFEYCDACASKPGSPPLCGGCLHNQTAWSVLEKDRDRWRMMHPLRFAVIRVLDVIGKAAARRAIEMGRLPGSG